VSLFLVNMSCADVLVPPKLELQSDYGDDHLYPSPRPRLLLQAKREECFEVCLPLPSMQRKLPRPSPPLDRIRLMGSPSWHRRKREGTDPLYPRPRSRLPVPSRLDTHIRLVPHLVLCPFRDLQLLPIDRLPPQLCHLGSYDHLLRPRWLHSHPTSPPVHLHRQ
jgi:hypothetical protein